MHKNPITKHQKRKDTVIQIQVKWGLKQIAYAEHTYIKLNAVIQYLQSQQQKRRIKIEKVTIVPLQSCHKNSPNNY